MAVAFSALHSTVTRACVVEFAVLVAPTLEVTRDSRSIAAIPPDDVSRERIVRGF
jgi:hypothetical protein